MDKSLKIFQQLCSKDANQADLLELQNSKHFKTFTQSHADIHKMKWDPDNPRYQICKVA